MKKLALLIAAVVACGCEVQVNKRAEIEYLQKLVAGSGVRVTHRGSPLPLGRRGYDHFAP